MAVIFLSYSRGDGGYTPILVRALEAAGHEVWWDRHIDSGEEFTARIEAALEKADIVLVAWSKQSVKSRWVRDEAAVGADTGRLVPVSVDGSQPPMGFRQFQTLDLKGWKGTEKEARTTELLGSIARRLEANGKAGPAPFASERKSRSAWLARQRLSAIAAAFVLAIAAATVIHFWNRGQPSGPPTRPTVVLLPFTAASTDARLRDVAAQVRDSIAHTLAQSSVPVRQLVAAPRGREAGDFLISGELSRNGDKLVATVRLVEAAQGVTVFSRRIEAATDQTRDLPERVGAQIAGTLTWGAALMMLDSRHRSDPALMAELLKQLDFTGDPLQAYQSAQRVAKIAPDSGIAQLNLAFGTAFVLGQLPRGERADALVAARRAAERARALAPQFGDTYGPWCFLHSETRMAECEDRLRAGKLADPDAPFLNFFLAGIARSAGRFGEAGELTELSYTHDPYVPTKIRDMLRVLEFAGEREEAEALFEKGVRWWPEFKDGFLITRFFGTFSRGDLEAISRIEEDVGVNNLPAGYPDSSAFIAALRSRSPAAVGRTCVGAQRMGVMIRCMIALARLGDYDGAFGLADKLYPKRIGRTSGETERIWLDDPEGGAPLEFITSPAAAPMRRDPRYLQLAQRVGLLAYWRSGRLPDFCTKQPEPICAHLLKRN